MTNKKLLPVGVLSAVESCCSKPTNITVSIAEAVRLSCYDEAILHLLGDLARCCMGVCQVV